MTIGPHRIFTQRIELEIPSVELSTPIQDRVSRIGQERLKRAIERVLDRFDPGERRWQLPQIDLQLDPIRYDHLENDLIDEVVRKLTAYLEQQQKLTSFHPLEEGEEEKQELEWQPDRLELLGHYLLTGALPWTVSETDYLPDRELRELLTSQRSALLAGIRQWGMKERVRVRLAFEFQDVTLRQLVLGLDPGQGNEILDIMDESRELHRREPIVQEDAETFNRRLWQFVLYYLLVEKSSHFDRKTFVKSEVRQLSAHYHIAYAELLGFLNELLKKESSTEQFDSLAQVLRELYDEEKRNQQPSENNTAQGELPEELSWQILKRGEENKQTGLPIEWYERLTVEERNWIEWDSRTFKSWLESPFVQERKRKAPETWAQMINRMQDERLAQEWENFWSEWNRGRPASRSVWKLWKHLLSQKELSQEVQKHLEERIKPAIPQMDDELVRHFLAYGSFPIEKIETDSDDFRLYMERLIQQRPARFRQIWQQVLHKKNTLSPVAVQWIKGHFPALRKSFTQALRSVEVSRWLNDLFRQSDRFQPDRIHSSLPSPAELSLEQVDEWVALVLERDPQSMRRNFTDQSRTRLVFEALKPGTKTQWIEVLLNYYSVSYKRIRKLYFKFIIDLQMHFGLNQKRAELNEQNLLFALLISGQRAEHWPVYFMREWIPKRKVSRKGLSAFLKSYPLERRIRKKWMEELGLPSFQGRSQQSRIKKKEATKPTDATSVKESSVGSLDAWLHYLLTGSVPWWGKEHGGQTPEVWLDGLLQKDPRLVRRRLVDLNWTASARKRLADAAKGQDRTKRLLAVLWAGEDVRAQLWMAYQQVLQSLSNSTNGHDLEGIGWSGFKVDPLSLWWVELLAQVKTAQESSLMSPENAIRLLHRKMAEALGWMDEPWNLVVLEQLKSFGGETMRQLERYFSREWQAVSVIREYGARPALGPTEEAFAWFFDSDSNWQQSLKDKNKVQQRRKWLSAHGNDLLYEAARSNQWERLATRMDSFWIKDWLKGQVSTAQTEAINEWLMWVESATQRGLSWGHWKINRNEMNAFVLHWFFRHSGRPFQFFRLAEDLVNFLVQRSGENPARVMDRLSQVLPSSGAWMRELKKSKPSLLQQIQFGQQHLGKDPLKLKPELQEEPTDGKSEEPEEEDGNYTSVFVRNAGLVLLSPYLSPLFDRLNWLAGGKFKSRKDAYRAVHLLEYLATGEEHPAEHRLVLNKYLCGLQAVKPVDTRLQLRKKEKEMADGLLKAVIQNWSALGSTSVEGFRESFLKREGKLTEEDELVRLQVETQAFDVLLDRLPWTYRQIKFSWMKKMLFTEWR